MAHIFNPSTQEAEAGESLRSRPAWSTDGVTEHQEKTLSQPPPNFFLMHVGILPACMCKAHGSQEGVTAPGTGVIASCELSWKAKIQPWSSRRAANVLHHSANANSWKLL